MIKCKMQIISDKNIAIASAIACILVLFIIKKIVENRKCTAHFTTMKCDIECGTMPDGSIIDCPPKCPFAFNTEKDVPCKIECGIMPDGRIIACPPPACIKDHIKLQDYQKQKGTIDDSVCLC